MIWLGLLVSIAYIPGYTGASIPTGWVVLSVALPWFLWRSVGGTPILWAGAGFLTYAFASLFWTPSLLDGAWALWLLAIVALSFWLGLTQPNLRGIYKGLAAGLTLSSLVALLQLAGYQPVLDFGDHPAGLMFNSVVLGESAALVTIALATERLWWWFPGLVPALAFSQSRGAWLVLILAAIAWLSRPWIAAALLAALAIAFAILAPSSDTLRLTIWHEAFANLTLFGHGAGSFTLMLIPFNTQLYHPEYAHNEPLDLLYQYGIGALPLFWLACILAWSLREAREWPIFASWLVLSLFSFPLHAPLLVFLGALSAGRLAANYGYAWTPSFNRRLSLLPLEPSSCFTLPPELGTPIQLRPLERILKC